MLIARIRLNTGPYSGVVTYAEVLHDGDRYLPIADPFEPSIAFVPAESVAAESVSLLAPCNPRVVLGMAHNTGPADRLMPAQAFHKSPHSVIGPAAAIELQPEQDEVDAEAELAVVIGTPARNLRPDNALAAVFGYTCANDVTDRAAQVSDSRWTEAKSRDTFTPLGPWIRTDLDPSGIDVMLGDGITETLGNTSDLARSVIEVLVYLTLVLTLHPGDVVLVGAPGASRRLRPGATSTVRIPGIGTLQNPVRTTSAVVDPGLLLAGTGSFGAGS